MVTKSIKGRIMYEANCPICSSYIGFRTKYVLHKPCRPCANRITKTGKPSPKKGIKTNKPSWNKGLKYSLIPIEHKMLKHALRTALNIRLKAHGSSKCYQRTFDLLGYSVEELKQHLESKFLPGMTWENRSEWHIDHIRPDSSFVYTSVTDSGFKASWALENLQPLWAVDNLKKSNKMP